MQIQLIDCSLYKTYNFDTVGDWISGEFFNRKINSNWGWSLYSTPVHILSSVNSVQRKQDKCILLSMASHRSSERNIFLKKYVKYIFATFGAFLKYSEH